MLKNFRVYQLSLQFYRGCEKLKLPRHLRDQVLRASSSVVLNLAEGSGKATQKDKRRFYQISLGSLRECQSILDLAGLSNSELAHLADQMGGGLYRLCHPKVEV